MDRPFQKYVSWSVKVSVRHLIFSSGYRHSLDCIPGKRRSHGGVAGRRVAGRRVATVARSRSTIGRVIACLDNFGYSQMLGVSTGICSSDMVIRLPSFKSGNSVLPVSFNRYAKEPTECPLNPRNPNSAFAPCNPRVLSTASGTLEQGPNREWPDAPFVEES